MCTNINTVTSIDIIVDFTVLMFTTQQDEMP